jgi:hypothetical protein
MVFRVQMTQATHSRMPLVVHSVAVDIAQPS